MTDIKIPLPSTPVDKDRDISLHDGIQYVGTFFEGLKERISDSFQSLIQHEIDLNKELLNNMVNNTSVVYAGTPSGYNSSDIEAKQEEERRLKQEEREKRKEEKENNKRNNKDRLHDFAFSLVGASGLGDTLRNIKKKKQQEAKQEEKDRLAEEKEKEEKEKKKDEPAKQSLFPIAPFVGPVQPLGSDTVVSHLRQIEENTDKKENDEERYEEAAKWERDINLSESQLEEQKTTNSLLEKMLEGSDKEEETSSGGGLLGFLMGSMIGAKLKGMVGAVGAGLKKAFTLLFSPRALLKVLSKVIAPVAIIATLGKGIMDGFKEFSESGSILEAVKAGLGGMLEFISFGLFDKDSLSGLFDWMGTAYNDYIKEPLNKFLIDPIKNMFESVSNWFTSIGESLMGFFSEFKIPGISFKVMGKEIGIGPWQPFKKEESGPEESIASDDTEDKEDTTIVEKVSKAISYTPIGMGIKAAKGLYNKVFGGKAEAEPVTDTSTDTSSEPAFSDIDPSVPASQPTAPVKDTTRLDMWKKVNTLNVHRDLKGMSVEELTEMADFIDGEENRPGAKASWTKQYFNKSIMIDNELKRREKSGISSSTKENKDVSVKSEIPVVSSSIESEIPEVVPSFSEASDGTVEPVVAKSHATKMDMWEKVTKLDPYRDLDSMSDEELRDMSDFIDNQKSKQSQNVWNKQYGNKSALINQQMRNREKSGSSQDSITEELKSSVPAPKHVDTLSSTSKQSIAGNELGKQISDNIKINIPPTIVPPAPEQKTEILNTPFKNRIESNEHSFNRYLRSAYDF